MFWVYLLLPVGFIFLIKGADFLVDGAAAIAKKLGISSIVIGLTIVAFGTSAPELIVNIFASANGNTDLAIGNVLGSNITNILLILGVSAIIYPLIIKRNTVWKEIPLSLLAVIVIGLMVNDVRLDGASFSGLNRIDGLVLIAFFIIFLYYTFSISKVTATDQINKATPTYSWQRASLMVLVGLVGLTLGGKWIVDSAVALATLMGVSQTLIGLTIVAIGTSLPELATSAIAAYKKNTDIAVGNIVGSNIFNIFWVLGISAIIKPLPFAPVLMRDVIMAIIAPLFLFIFIFMGKKKHTLERWQGLSFIVLYLVYLIFLVAQEMAL